MPPIPFRINVLGAPEVVKALAAVGGIEKHRPGLNALIHGKMKMQIRETFDKQRDPVTGQPWKPVLPFGHGLDPSHKILQSTAGAGLIGALMAAPLVTAGDEIFLGPPPSIGYANIHQFGGVIRPRNAKNLAIPLTKEAARAGSASRWWRHRGKGPFIHRAKTGKKSLFIAAEEDGKLVLHWLLLKMVNIPQRRYLGWNDEYRQGVADIVQKRITVIARNAGFNPKGGKP